MRRARVIAAIAVCLMAYNISYAQVRTLPTRAEIESIVHPKLSTTAKRAVCGESVEVGKIDGSESITAHFTLRNTTDHSVTITEFRTLCDCMQVITKPKVMASGESMTIEARFNPAGRVGSFEQAIYVYTTLDERHPTEQLTLTGEIAATERFSHLRHTMGTLRLSRKEVTLDGIKEGATRSERIVVANSGSETITIGATPTIAGLSIAPVTLKPNEEGELVVSYTSNRLPAYDIETMVVVEGVTTPRPTERMIKITIKR